MKTTIARLSQSVLAAAVVAMAVPAVHANTTVLDFTGPAWPTSNNWFLSGTIKYDQNSDGDFSDSFNVSQGNLTRAESLGVGAGGFNMTINNTSNSLIAWCVDIFHTLNGNPKTYTTSDSFSSNAVFADLQKLANQRYVQVNNFTTSAAYQLAVWEIVNETSGSYGLGGGRFQATGFSTDAISTANNWLTALGVANNTGNYKITYFDDSSGTTQDLISMSPVPLPGAAVLMLSALGLGGVLRRRQANKTAA